MASEQGNDPHPHPNHGATARVTPLVDEVASLSVTETKDGPDSTTTAKNEDIGAGSSVQPPQSRPLFNTPEGRIAAYRRMIDTNNRPDHRANFEALIKYYQDGGKVPQGQEEVWAFDGQASFGIRHYTSLDQMPEGWLYKVKYRDVR